MNTLAINDPKFSVTRTGIEFREDLSFDEWDALGQKLCEAEKSLGFIIGDWINYGEKRYGDKYDEALERTGLSYDTLRHYAYVARKIEMCLRKHNLDYSLHATVAKLKTNEEKHHWLDMAEKHKLTVRRLRKSINFGRLATEDEVQGDPADRGYVTYLALLNRIRRWWSRETQKAPVDEWDEDRRQGLKKDFKLIHDIYEAL
jgi:hypothetical protein